MGISFPISTADIYPLSSNGLKDRRITVRTTGPCLSTRHRLVLSIEMSADSNSSNKSFWPVKAALKEKVIVLYDALLIVGLP